MAKQRPATPLSPAASKHRHRAPLQSTAKSCVTLSNRALGKAGITYRKRRPRVAPIGLDSTRTLNQFDVEPGMQAAACDARRGWPPSNWQALQ